jgi:hypothetical protein
MIEHEGREFEEIETEVILSRVLSGKEAASSASERGRDGYPPVRLLMRSNPQASKLTRACGPGDARLPEEGRSPGPLSDLDRKTRQPPMPDAAQHSPRVLNAKGGRRWPP